MPTLIDSRRNGPDFLSLPPGRGRDRGRGARSNDTSRHERFKHHVLDDGWESLADLPALKTQVTAEAAKSIITRNNSPDISFDRSINPYQGCEHGCSYCYARPTHANFGLSPGLDFESKLFAKTNAAELLCKELAAPGYRPATIALGANTDPYQPIEKRYRITRQILEVLSDYNHPVGIVTKSSLVVRDLDILKDMAERNLVKVAVSITTLEPRLARAMEPRASRPGRRLQAVEMLAGAGVPVTVMVAPVVPALNDSEIEAVLKSAACAGAAQAGYVLLRLPLEVRDIFCEWLASEFPDRAAHVLSLMRQMRQGRDYDATWGRRQTGTGPYAWSIGRRFEIACRRLGLNQRKVRLSTDLFKRPPQTGDQLTLL
jgi:DNA repair photolyase